MHSMLPTHKAVDNTYVDKIAVNVRPRTLGRSTSSLLGLTLGLLLLAGCAGSIPSSTRYEGVYQLTATPMPPSSRDPGCAPFTKNVVVRDGRLEFVTQGADGTDAWQGTVDADGDFHGGIVLDDRTFGLTRGVDVPGDFGDSSDNRCQWHYAFQYEGTADDAPQD